MTIKDEFSDEGIRYLRGQDLGDLFISDSNPVYIPRELYDGMPRCHMKPDDVLLSVIGTVGSVSLVTDKYDFLTGSCKIVILRADKVNPYFLAAYLMSDIGQGQIQRRVRGAVQQGLILPDLKVIPVPTVSDEHATKVGSLIKQSLQQKRDSVNLYAEAERLLAAELGLDRLDLSESLFSVRRVSDVLNDSRMDAEHYKQKYYRVLQTLKNIGAKEVIPLQQIVTILTNGHTPLHHDLDVGDIPFLTAEHVYDFWLDYDNARRIWKEHHETEVKRTKLRKNDVLITIKGRVGNAAVVEHLPGDVNINQDVALLRLKPGIHPYYVVGFLNSPAGKALMEQIATGQINPFLGLGNLAKVRIPIFDEKRMNAIGENIRQTVDKGYQAKEDAKRLLAEAKSEVERLIEG